MSGQGQLTALAPQAAGATRAGVTATAAARVDAGEPVSDPPTLNAQPRMRAIRVTAVFDAAADQVRHARHFAEAMLRDWLVATDAAFVVSELAANATLHSASRDGGQFWVHLEAYPGQYAWVEVRDQGGPWIRRDHAEERPHGLDIVGELAADWGVDGDARTGWIAWARLDLPRPAAGAVTSASVPCAGRPARHEQAPGVNGTTGHPGMTGAEPGSPRLGPSCQR